MNRPTAPADPPVRQLHLERALDRGRAAAVEELERLHRRQPGDDAWPGRPRSRRGAGAARPAGRRARSTPGRGRAGAGRRSAGSWSGRAARAGRPTPVPPPSRTSRCAQPRACSASRRSPSTGSSTASTTRSGRSPNGSGRQSASGAWRCDRRGGRRGERTALRPPGSRPPGHGVVQPGRRHVDGSARGRRRRRRAPRRGAGRPVPAPCTTTVPCAARVEQLAAPLRRRGPTARSARRPAAGAASRRRSRRSTGARGAAARATRRRPAAAAGRAARPARSARSAPRRRAACGRRRCRRRRSPPAAAPTSSWASLRRAPEQPRGRVAARWPAVRAMRSCGPRCQPPQRATPVIHSARARFSTAVPIRPHVLCTPVDNLVGEMWICLCTTWPDRCGRRAGDGVPRQNCRRPRLASCRDQRVDFRRHRRAAREVEVRRSPGAAAPCRPTATAAGSS